MVKGDAELDEAMKVYFTRPHLMSYTLNPQPVPTRHHKVKQVGIYKVNRQVYSSIACSIGRSKNNWHWRWIVFHEN